VNDSNATTVQSYDGHIQEYIDATPQAVDGFIQTWINNVLAGLLPTAKILEFGTAFGRDADYIESKGYTVERTDVTPGFVKLLQDKGHKARILNAITDGLGSDYDLIFADAVLLHFTRDEVQRVIGKVYDALADEGHFAFSLKLGEGEEWEETKLNAPRFFCYWSKETIQPVLEQAGFKDIQITDDHVSNVGSKAKWIHIIAVKGN
jgi:predicted TPR repeat methyltransferase